MKKINLSLLFINLFLFNFSLSFSVKFEKIDSLSHGKQVEILKVANGYALGTQGSSLKGYELFLLNLNTHKVKNIDTPFEFFSGNLMCGPISAEGNFILRVTQTAPEKINSKTQNIVFKQSTTAFGSLNGVLYPLKEHLHANANQWLNCDKGLVQITFDGRLMLHREDSSDVLCHIPSDHSLLQCSPDGSIIIGKGRDRKHLWFYHSKVGHAVYIDLPQPDPKEIWSQLDVHSILIQPCSQNNVSTADIEILCYIHPKPMLQKKFSGRKLLQNAFQPSKTLEHASTLQSMALDSGLATRSENTESAKGYPYLLSLHLSETKTQLTVHKSKKNHSKTTRQTSLQLESASWKKLSGLFSVKTPICTSSFTMDIGNFPKLFYGKNKKLVIRPLDMDDKSTIISKAIFSNLEDRMPFLITFQPGNSSSNPILIGHTMNIDGKIISKELERLLKEDYGIDLDSKFFDSTLYKTTPYLSSDGKHLLFTSIDKLGDFFVAYIDFGLSKEVHKEIQSSNISATNNSRRPFYHRENQNLKEKKKERKQPKGK